MNKLKQMKIVYVIGSIANSGGIERVLCTKANYLADQLGYEVHIVQSKASGDTFFPFLPSIRMHSLDVKATPSKLGRFFSDAYQKEYKARLEAFLYGIRPNITISTFGMDAQFLYKIQDGSVKVLEFHFTKNYLRHLGESLTNDKLRFLRKYWLEYLLWKEEQLAKKYEHIVLLTEKDKQLWGGGERFKVIPNPLSFQSEKVSELNQKKIISMGRLVLPKGFHLLIKAFALLVNEFSDWKIVIYGEGHDKEYLNKLIKDLSLQERIFIEPPVRDVRAALLDSSLFVFPSRYEGFGLVLTEAMECGVPCVAFDCECGPSDIIRDGEDGFIVSLDDVEALAGKMRMLMRDNELRANMGKHAKENIQRFQPDSVMKIWNAYFCELIDKKNNNR